MFVWRASTLLECIGRYEPATAAGLARVAAAWGGAGSGGSARARSIRPAEGERRFRGHGARLARPDFRVAADADAAGMAGRGLLADVRRDLPARRTGNALAAARHVLVDTRRTLVASSDPRHLIATIGCEDLVIIHTPDATLVCPADRAEEIKKVYGLVGERFGGEYT